MYTLDKKDVFIYSMQIMTDRRITTKEIVLKILFILAIFVIIIILAFAIIKFIPKAFSIFASVGNTITSPFAREKVSVEVNDSSLNTGDKFVLTWKYKSSNDGDFYIKYGCFDNLNLNIYTKDSARKLLCNTQYSVTNMNGEVELAAILDKKESFVDLPIQILFIEKETEDIKAVGETLVTIQNSNSVIGTNAANTTLIGEPITSDNADNNSQVNSNSNSELNSTQPAQVGGNTISPIYRTPADLAIRNLIRINNYTIRFDVANIGGKNTGTWFFNYTIPGEPIEWAPLQPSLTPGSSIRYTLTYDSADRGLLRVTLDPSNLILETNKNNNIASVYVNYLNENGNDFNNYDRNDDADLIIKNMEVGKMSGSHFIEDDDIRDYDDAAVKFTVINRGGENTGSWRFEIKELPYNNSDRYESRRQRSLRPGESIEIIVELENPDEGRYEIEVEIDSDDDVDEENEHNNDESENLRVRD